MNGSPLNGAAVNSAASRELTTLFKSTADGRAVRPDPAKAAVAGRTARPDHSKASVQDR